MNISRDVEDAVPYNQTLRMSQLCRGLLSSADSVKSQNDCHRQSATSTPHGGFIKRNVCEKNFTKKHKKHKIINGVVQ